MRFVFKLYSSRKYLTCDHASIFFRGGKERLIQLLDYSSAAPLLKYLSARMPALPSPDKNERSRITGDRFVGENYTRHEQREFTCNAVQYGRQKYGLFCKTRPPVTFVMSKFQKQNKKCYLYATSVSLGEGTVPLSKPTNNKEFCGGFRCGVGCIVSFTAVFWDVTQRSQKTAAKEIIGCTAQ